ncbi:MAG: aldehyde dehydrogenase [Bryobacteraceae bacterium]
MQAAAAPVRSPRVQAFLSESPLGLFIDGRSRPSAREARFSTIDPGSGAPLAEVYSGEAEDVDAAVAAAARAFRETAWPRLSPEERGVYLHRLADLAETRKQTLAEIESLDVGKPFAQALWDVDNFVQTLRYYTGLALHAPRRQPVPLPRIDARTVRFPWGVCAFIFPWNFPLLLAGWGISPALAAGNTVVIKPAEDTPLSTLYLCRLAQEAGIPDGVINVVTGFGETAGAALARHPDIARMSFTGSPEVGKLVAVACARNLVPAKLELGGKGAAVVFEDVDVEQTADALTRAVTLNCGQVCCTATRWIVQESIYDYFVEHAVHRMGRVHPGYWNDPLAEMGPLISQKQMDRVLGYLNKGREQGAELPLEGGATEVVGYEDGFWVRPALLAGSPENVACREEIFGPVAYLLKFRTEEEAVALVNQSAYGLANSVWTQDLARANRVAEAMVAGNSWINAHNIFAHGLPYCGVKLSGTGGGVLGPETLYDYLRPQSIARPCPA